MQSANSPPAYSTLPNYSSVGREYPRHGHSSPRKTRAYPVPNHTPYLEPIRHHPVSERTPLNINIISTQQVDSSGTVAALLILLFLLPMMAFILGVAYYQDGPHFYWEIPVGNPHCASYGTREYTAHLRDVPWFHDRMLACQNTPVVIRNVILKSPDYCEDFGSFGGIIGHWFVNFGEANCMPHWGQLTDWRCTGWGLHRFEARLWNIAQGEDWANMCATTPIDIDNTHFDTPKYCDNLGIFGIYGTWELDDPDC